MAGPALSFDNGQPDAWGRAYSANAGIFPYFLSHGSLCLVPQWMSVLWICVIASWGHVHVFTLFTISFWQGAPPFNYQFCWEVSLLVLALSPDFYCMFLILSVNFLFIFPTSLFVRIVPLNFLFREMKHLNPHPVCTFACSKEAGIWGGRGSFQQRFLQYRLKVAPSLAAEQPYRHLSSSTPRGMGSQVGWGVSDLREQWRSHPHLLNAHERGAGMREPRVGTMHPVHFRRLSRSVKSLY